MVKRREKKEHSEAEIENFINAADHEPQHQDLLEERNPNAKRNYKNIRLSLNKYEYERLQLLAEKTNRNKLNAIRWAVEQMIEKLDSETLKL